MTDERIYRDVIEAALDFSRLELWRRFGNSDAFAARVPGQRYPLLGVVMGKGGEEYGLTMFRGAGAHRCLLRLLDPDGAGDDVESEADLLGFSMEAYDAMPPDAKAVVRKAGLCPRSGEAMPWFVAKGPGRYPETPNVHDMRILLLVLRGAIEAHRRGEMAPGAAVAETLLTLILTEDPDAPLASVQWEAPAEDDESKAGVIRFPASAADLTDLPRLEATWLAALPAAPMRIENDPHEVRLLMVVDDDSEFVFRAEPIFAGAIADAVDAILDVCRGKSQGPIKGLPRRILFSSRALCDAAAPVLQAVGVVCEYKPSIPKLERIVAEFLACAGGNPPLSGNSF